MLEGNKDLSCQSSLSDIWLQFPQRFYWSTNTEDSSIRAKTQPHLTLPELTSCPHKLILKKWKYFVPLEVKLGPFIKEPTAEVAEVIMQTLIFFHGRKSSHCNTLSGPLTINDKKCKTKQSKNNMAGKKALAAMEKKVLPKSSRFKNYFSSFVLVMAYFTTLIQKISKLQISLSKVQKSQNF